MDTETEHLVKELAQQVAELKSEIVEKDEVIRALTGELIKKNQDPDYLDYSRFGNIISSG